MIAIDPSQHNAWTLGCIKACQVLCLIILLLIFNVFIKRALGKDYNRPDSLELRQQRYKVLNGYKKLDDFRSLLIDVRTALFHRNLCPPTQSRHKAYINPQEIPFFRSYDWRDTRKQLYCPQNVWFIGCEIPFGIGTDTSSTVFSEGDELLSDKNQNLSGNYSTSSDGHEHSVDEFFSGDDFTSEEDWNDYYSYSSSSDYPNSDADESHYHEVITSS